MPTSPSTYSSGPLSAQQLNADMYSANATITGATGILFHAHRPLLSETVLTGSTAYTALSQQRISLPGITAFSVIDNTALYGIGADDPGISSLFVFRNFVNASSGILGGYSGQWLTWGFPFTGNVTNPPGGMGANMFLNGALQASGVFQYGSTGHNNCTWYLDLIATGYGSVNTWQPGFWWLTASTPVIVGNISDTVQSTTRMGWLWTGVSTGGGTVTSIPAPVLNWGTVTSAALNTGLGSCLTLLNNPPMLRVTTASSQAFSNLGTVAVLFPVTPNVDNYSSWSTASSVYTAPLPGLYLFCPNIGWGTQSSAGIRYCGLETRSGGTGSIVFYQGPTYKATAVGPGVTGAGMTGTSVVRVLNLAKGDSVVPYGFQNSGLSVTLLSSYGSRFIGAYMGQAAAAGTTLTYSVPSTAFRWQAGALSGTALTAAMNQHLGLDIAFLMNKPYFTGYQTAAQNLGTASGVFSKVVIDTVGTLPNAGNGDNYGGWDAANHWYASQVAGWYLCIADLYASPPASGTAGVVTGGLFISSSGSIVPSATPDTYQQIAYPVSTGGPPPGVTAIGLYYLQPGEHIYPVMATQGWGGTWGTYTSNTAQAQIYSQFSCFWVAS